MTDAERIELIQQTYDVAQRAPADTELDLWRAWNKPRHASWEDVAFLLDQVRQKNDEIQELKNVLSRGGWSVLPTPERATASTD